MPDNLKHPKPIITRAVENRASRIDAFSVSRGTRLRLTKKQRQFLKEGAMELKRYFEDPVVWENAAFEAEKVQQELGIPNFVPGFTMWTSSIAALAHGAWWLLMPGCGTAELRTSVCRSLKKPFLERRPEYKQLAEAIKQGKYPLISEILERTERVRCMLAMHVRESE